MNKPVLLEDAFTDVPQSPRLYIPTRPEEKPDCIADLALKEWGAIILVVLLFNVLLASLPH